MSTRTVDVNKLVEAISAQRNAAQHEAAILQAQLQQAEEENTDLRAELEKLRIGIESGGGVGHP